MADSTRVEQLKKQVQKQVSPNKMRAARIRALMGGK